MLRGEGGVPFVWFVDCSVASSLILVDLVAMESYRNLMQRLKGRLMRASKIDRPPSYVVSMEWFQLQQCHSDGGSHENMAAIGVGSEYHFQLTARKCRSPSSPFEFFNAITLARR